MTEIAAISTAITALKTAIDIAKAINDTDKSLEKAELKMKIATLMEALADAKIQMIYTKEIIQQKDAEIKELETSLEKRETASVLDDYYDSVIKILGEIDKEVWSIKKIWMYEHHAKEHLCEVTGQSEMTIKVIVDCLIEEGFCKVQPGEYSLPQIQTTEKGRMFLFKAERLNN